MKRRSESERRQILEDYRRSGLTQEAFAKRHGVKVDTLRGWVYRARAPKAKTPSRQPAHRGGFVEVRPASSPERRRPVVLRFRDRVTIELEDLPPAEYLAGLIRVLG